jgi:WD40 repeat protein
MSASDLGTRSVFISYARKDGAEVARRLHTTLCEAGCVAWMDTDRIAGGASWSKVIEDALNDCDCLIAVISEGSYVSEICRAEQMWALERRKRVIPVLASRNAPRPVHLFTLNYRTFPVSGQELLADLKAELPADLRLPPPRYDTIPPLPRSFIPRKEAVAALREVLFGEGEESKIGISAVAGMGGIGKTVLATALCRDTAVQRAFPDGIAWITMGREWDGKVVAQMREVGRALGEDVERGWDTKVACENSYRTLLRQKASLIVVDDVWSAEHLPPLAVDDAPRSRLLFTTRDAGIARTLTDRTYSAHVLTKSEARELLARSSATKEPDLAPEADEIIKCCAGLALAIAQIGASLRTLSRIDWQDTLSLLQRVDIQAIQERLPPGQESFFKSLAVSVKALPSHIEKRYLKLAVLLEDVPAPLAVLRTLWNLDQVESRHSARYFVERSLATWAAADDPALGIKLHDLQLDYVRACFPDGETLHLIHGAVRLSAHVIQGDPLQFASQVTGRLLVHRDSKEMSGFLRDLVKGAAKPWLRAFHPVLHPPGTGLLRTLEGHTNWVMSVALTADGKRAISGSVDKTLKVWDLDSGRVLRTLEGHTDPVNSVALTRNGRWAVSASGETLKVWDLDSGCVLHTLEGHTHLVNSVTLTEDGKRAVSASWDHTLKVWDLESGRALRTLKGHTDRIASVVLTTDGQWAVSTSWDKTRRVWDLDSGDVWDADSVNGVMLAAGGRWVISALGDKALEVWDLDSGHVFRTLEGHTESVNSVALTADGKRAVSASDDKTLKVWDLYSGHVLRTLEGHIDSVNSVALTADGKRAVSASHDRTLKVWDLNSGRALPVLEGHTDSVHSVALTADGKRAISASYDETLKVWDLETGRAMHTLKGHTSQVNSVALTADGKRAVSASFDRTLKVWDLDSGRALRTLEGHTLPVESVALTADGQRAVSASNLTLKVWDLDSGHFFHTLEVHTDSVHSVAMTADGKRAVSASWDKTLKVWDLESGLVLRTLTGHTHWVNSVALTSDGKRAVSASYDKTLRVWDLESERLVLTLEGHTSTVNSVGLTADGRRAVSASSDNTLKVWDLESGICLASFYADSALKCCAVAGQNIVAGDIGGHVHFLMLEE